MDAMEKGYKRGREYLRRCRIEETTFEQYQKFGKVDVKQQYKQKKAQDQYLLGWWHAGEQFATLFKTDDNETYSALKRIKTIQQRLGELYLKVGELQEWREDDATLQGHLENAYDAIAETWWSLDRAKEHLDKE